MPDELLGGRYRLLRQLAEGGMGEVWEAEDETLERRVAVKVISLLTGGGSRGEEARARFLREARITAGLQHPNIVTIHDLGELDTAGSKAPFLVMELLRGESLDTKLREGTVPLHEVARWGAQISDALADAHDAGIMHRDIKPSNILVTPSGTVKVLDFGIARAADLDATADRLTQTGFIVGTPPYMAPEQAHGAPEPRSDLYGLGCVLFELATGQLPFQATDTVGYLSAHLTKEPPAPSSVHSDIPPAWDDLVLALLRKDPDLRHANATELARALRKLADTSGHTPGEGGTAPTPTRIDTDSLRPSDPTSEAHRTAIATVRLALLCLPGLLYLTAKAFQYLPGPSAPAMLLSANMWLGLVEMVMLGTGALLLARHRLSGRRMLTAAGGAVAVHGLSVSVQYPVLGGSSDAAVVALLVAPLTAASAVATVVTALRPATGQWCQQQTAPGSGPGSGFRSLPSRARTAIAATTFACLLTTPIVPFTLDEMVSVGALPHYAWDAQALLWGLQAGVLLIGLLLLLGGNAAGSWLILVSGFGLALQVLTLAMSVSGALVDSGQLLLPLTALTAAASALLTVFPPADSRRQKSSW